MKPARLILWKIATGLAAIGVLSLVGGCSDSMDPNFRLPGETANSAQAIATPAAAPTTSPQAALNVPATQPGATP